MKKHIADLVRRYAKDGWLKFEEPIELKSFWLGERVKVKSILASQEKSDMAWAYVNSGKGVNLELLIYWDDDYVTLIKEVEKRVSHFTSIDR